MSATILDYPGSGMVTTEFINENILIKLSNILASANPYL